MPLFVGGVCDGEWHAVPPDRDEWTLAQYPRLADRGWENPTVPVKSLEMKKSDYRRMKWRGLKETFEFFAVRGMKPDQAFERLLRNYRPAESEE